MTAMRSRAQQPPASMEAPADFVDFYTTSRLGTFRAVRRLAGNDDLAHEATQEAYARMFVAWTDRQWSDPESNRRYVVVIARNVLIDWYRRNHRVGGLLDHDESAATDPGFDAVLDDMTIGRAVRDLLAQQPVIRRAIAVLYFLDGYSYREIAAMLGSAESTVRNHVLRFRRLLGPYRERLTALRDGGERS